MSYRLKMPNEAVSPPIYPQALYAFVGFRKGKKLWENKEVPIVSCSSAKQPSKLNRTGRMQGRW